jgi:hypothetical protein
MIFLLDIFGFPCHWKIKKMWKECLVCLGSHVCFWGTKDDTIREKTRDCMKWSGLNLVILCHLLLQYDAQH